jgi:membrane peptidoglycan carboxypeptidase
MFGAYEYLSSTTTIPAALASANYQNTTVYYADGKTVIGTIGSTNRQDLTYAQIPMQLQDAVVAAEDKNFWTEGGISPTGIVRAAYHDLTSGGSLNGGSTITQEFVKNYYDGVGTQQTATRKIKEVFIAQKLASTKSKQWIMTNFLNLIYLGKNSYGMAAASETYFGKPVSQLTWAQDAFLAGIIQEPSTYPLLSNRPIMIARWKYVLQQMVLDKYITAAQASSMTFPKLLTDSATGASKGASVTAASADPWSPYVLNVVYNELTSPKSLGGDGIPVSQVETGGLKVVTTISYSMEKEMYKAVDANIAAIKAIPGAQFPSYIRIGAELQNPSNGEIVAMYPGPGQSMSASDCAKWDCSDNTAVYTREQVGSSFKPYVLSAAVADGMNVKTSTLNANQYLCVPPDTQPTTLSKTQKYYSGSLSQCADSGLNGYFPVENDGGEVIGNPKQGGGTTVQNAVAQSSNTAFTDLTHRVTTSNVIRMAAAFGVNIADYPTGSGLTKDVGQTNIALGIAPLTVNEQATMLSAIADNGVYHQAHIVKYWQQPNGPEQTPAVASHMVLDPSNPVNNAALDSQVQYAMEMTTVDGTGTAAAYGLGSRQIIAKTGTTSGSTAGFFIGAIPQYSLVVGMFVANPANTSESLVPLTGGGYGGYWPAKIWNTFAQSEFANLPQETFQNPVFTGDAWNQVPKQPKPTAMCWQNGKKVKMQVKTCPTPNPQVSCGFDQQTGQNDLCSTCTFNQADGQFDNCTTPVPTQNGCTYDQQTGQFDICNGSPSPSATCQPGDPACTSATPSPSSTCQNPADPACQANSQGAGPQTSGAAQGGFAIGGGLAGLPGAGSLLRATAARRRRRRRDGTAR